MEYHFFAIKTGTGQRYDQQGKRIGVTRLAIPAMTVLAVKPGTDNSQTVSIGIKAKPLVKCAKPQRQVFAKAKTTGFCYTRTITVPSAIMVATGAALPVDQLIKAGDWVMASARTKGRGFAGVVKRWGFAGGPKTHGQSDRWRAPGSIGMRTTPGRVWKGKKMSGHMGNKNKTIKGLRIVSIDVAHQEVLVQGMVPGSRGGLVAFARMGNRPPQPITLYTKEQA